MREHRWEHPLWPGSLSRAKGTGSATVRATAGLTGQGARTLETDWHSPLNESFLGPAEPSGAVQALKNGEVGAGKP
jgi:hypothetical protein